MDNFNKRIKTALSIFLTVGFFSAANAAEIYLPTNGNYLSPVRNAKYLDKATQYKAVAEDYVESDDFKSAQQKEKEAAVKKFLNGEIADIGIRILSILQAISEGQKSSEDRLVRY